MKKLIIDVLEKVDKEFILDDKYASIRKKEFANKHGIYALYDKNGKLYYVGRASDLNGRLKQHLKHNKHSGKWDYFSIYFTKNETASIEVEAIFLSLVWGWGKPEGNTQKPRVKKNKSMRERILKAMSKKNEEMFGGHRSKFSKYNSPKYNSLSRTRSSKSRPSLKGLVRENCLLKAEHKKSGKTFQATLLPSGEIKCKGKRYNSPSAAGKAATEKSQNGWTFWKIQNKSNKWITLSEFNNYRARGGHKASPLLAAEADSHTERDQARGGYKASPLLAAEADSHTERDQARGGHKASPLLAKLKHRNLLKRGVDNKTLKMSVSSGKVLTLQAKYKGKTYDAKLLSCGKRVVYEGKIYGSPSAAGKAVTGCSSNNGWDFWWAKDSEGQWVRLKSLRGFFTDKAS